MKDKPIMISIPARLTEEEVAHVLGTTVSSLRSQRSRRRGLPFRKLPNGQVLYDVEDIKGYLLGKKIYTKDSPEPVS